jgi:fatty-acyl-CoA synthase
VPLRFAAPVAEAYAYPLLIRHLLHAPLATARQQEIVYRDRYRGSYVDLEQRIGRLAGALSNLGVEEGHTVAVMDWDSHRYLECFFAIPMMGAVLQTVNVRLSPEQIAWTLAHASADVLLIHRDFLPLLPGIRERAQHLRAVVLIGDGEEPGVDQEQSGIAGEYEMLLSRAESGYAFRDFDENAIATTFYTTGTTGEPKGVCFSHRQLVLHTLAVMAASASPAYGQSFRRGDVYMPLTPMFHVHAWGNPFVATALGVKQVYPGRYIPEEILALRRREGVSFSHCVPTILRMLLSSAGAQDDALQGWKMCIGGSALSTGLAREALERGMDVYAGYGMSETGPVLAISQLDAPAGTLPAEQELAARCRTGKPIPLVDIRIVDEDGSPLPHDDRASGEIVVRAPWTTPCYTNNPTASDTLWRGGYLHTQDVARIDAHGSLQICDRLKDVIKTGGEWLSSLELEEILSRHPGVAEVAVVGVRDERWGERPQAFVVPHEGEVPTEDEIRDCVAAVVREGHLPRYAIPERVSFLSALPKTSVGKIDKRRLRDSAAAMACEQ